MQNPARGIRFSKQKDKTKEVWELTNGEFTELMQQYQRLIYTVCLQFVHDPHTAEDLTQDTFLSAFSAIDRCEPQYYKAVAGACGRQQMQGPLKKQLGAPGGSPRGRCPARTTGSTPR